MKKTIAALFALSTIAAFAGELLVTFSTEGTDYYADGTKVLDDECYSLVYTYADGTQKQVLVVQAAKDGKCMPVLFRISDSSAYTGGEWGVFLLDTRDFAKDATGQQLSDLDADGKPTVVNVTSQVKKGFASTGITNQSTEGGVTAGSYDLAAANVPAPKVTGIKIVGANVVVTVAETVPFVGYTLQAGSDVTNFSVPENTDPMRGNDSGEIKLVTPKKDGAQFFKVSTIQ